MSVKSHAFVFRCYHGKLGNQPWHSCHLSHWTEAIVAVRAITQIWSMIMIPVKSRKRRSQLAEWGFGWPPKNLHANTKNLERHTWHKRKVQYLGISYSAFSTYFGWILGPLDLQIHGGVSWDLKVEQFFFPEKGWNFCWVNIGVLSCKALPLIRMLLIREHLIQSCQQFWIHLSRYDLNETFWLGKTAGCIIFMHPPPNKKKTHCLRSGWRCPRLEFWSQEKNGSQKTDPILPRNLTWNLKMMVSKMNHLFQGLLFRFHVKFQGCTFQWFHMRFTFPVSAAAYWNSLLQDGNSGLIIELGLGAEWQICEDRDLGIDGYRWSNQFHFYMWVHMTYICIYGCFRK